MIKKDVKQKQTIWPQTTLLVMFGVVLADLKVLGMVVALIAIPALLVAI
jgi:hypothetical protein